MKKKLIVVAAAALLMTGISSTEAISGAANKCKVCHNFSHVHKVGPGLKGVVGRPAGSTNFSKYSKDLKSADWTWDEKHLRAWMCNSTKAIKNFTGNKHAKTKMPKQRICSVAKQDAVLKVLKSL